jgi:negative regulator of sigma E activity
MASSQEEWQRYQEAMRQGDKAAAAAAFQRYLEAKKAEGKGSSRPVLVNLSTKAKDYPNAVPLEDIPRVMQEKPEFFDLMKRMAEK